MTKKMRMKWRKLKLDKANENDKEIIKNENDKGNENDKENENKIKKIKMTKKMTTKQRKLKKWE